MTPDIIIGLFFSGMQAVSNMLQAYQAYKARQNQNGNGRYREVDYSRRYSMTLHRRAPTTQLHIPRARPTLPQPEPQQGCVNLKKFYQIFLKLTEPRVRDGPSQGHSVHGRFGGKVFLEREQRAPDTDQDTLVGVNTGRKPLYNIGTAVAHWENFESQSMDVSGTRSGTIAVCNWTENLITMYVKNDDYDQYFRNYHVHDSDICTFGVQYQAQHVFSGIIEDSTLRMCNDELVMVEDPGGGRFTSKNCWSKLGISAGRIQGEKFFVEMMRAALFGLVQCLYADPELINLDMLGGDGLQFVHVDSPFKDLESRGDCYFSVFSFCDNGWATDRVLVG